jgi:hypothetical protein
MSQPDQSAALADLSARVAALEDRLEIAQLLARYGPHVDSGAGERTAQLWTEDGVFDVPPMATWTGREQIAGMVDGEGHQGLIHNGVAHVLSPPRVVVEGDEARAWNHALHIRWDPEADRFWIFRTSANEWQFRRTPEGWRITSRETRTLDGDERAFGLFGGVS